MKKFFLSLVIAGALVSSVSAQVVFTLRTTANATFNTTTEGYTSGATYTFSFTTGADYPTLSTLSTSTFSAGNNNYWFDTTSSDSALFVSAGGTGLSGTFARPSGTDPQSYLYQGTTYDLLMGTDANASMGLTTLLGTGLKNVFWAGGTVTALSPAAAFSGSYVDPVDYFNARAGVYTATGEIRLTGTGNTQIASFAVNQLTIAAVPEPGTYAALAGLVGLGVAAYLRRRRATA